MENVLDYLYSREYGEEQEIRKDRQGGSDGSQLTVPSWLHQVKKLFPKQTVEVLERHALEKYGMTELLTDPEVLQKLELKHMMKGDVLQMAREIVRKVAEEIARRLEQEVRVSFFMKKYNQWRVIICVDESGSMLDSVIHSAIMAGIFAKLPMLDTKLVIFDTNVVDLSGYVDDPVDTICG